MREERKRVKSSSKLSGGGVGGGGGGGGDLGTSRVGLRVGLELEHLQTAKAARRDLADVAVEMRVGDAVHTHLVRS